MVRGYFKKGKLSSGVLNSMNPSGIPARKVIVKTGVIAVQFRNLKVFKTLLNGANLV